MSAADERHLPQDPGTDPPGPAPSRRSSGQLLRDPNLHIVFGVTLMAVMGVSSVAPAFPAVMRSLDVTEAQVGLLVTVFTLPGVVLTAVLGVLADRHGRKRILVPALVAFGIFGALCSLTRDFETLLVLRFMQGVGAAGIGALNMTVLGDMYSGRDLSATMGYNSSVLSVGTAAYPAIGGALAAFAWYWPFALPVFALPLALVVLWKLDNPEPTVDTHVRDYFAGLWDLVRDRHMVALFLASILTFVLLYGAILTYLPILIDRNFAASTTVIGIVLSTMSITSGITSALLGRLAARYGHVRLMWAGLGLYALALAAIPLMPGAWWLIVPSLVYGVANGLNIPTIITQLSADAPMGQRGAILSLNGMFLRLGQTIGPLLMGLLFVAGGLDLVYRTSSAIAAATLLVVGVLLMPRAHHRGAVD